ncbi:MAG: SGNH/GDSL hydrolase family protein [Nitrospirales bacterium]
MKLTDPRKSDPIAGEWGVLGSLYALEALVFLGLLALYRVSAKGAILNSLLTPWGIVLLVSTVTSLLLIWLVGRARWKAGPKKWLLSATMNALVVGTLALCTELALRSLSVQHPFSVYDEEVGGILLYPRQWQKVKAAHAATLTKARVQQTYLVPDQTLGWTIGLSRQSDSGMNFSSMEGLRSAAKGVSMQEGSATCRIALIGDSFTFGEAVRFEDTWGTILGKSMGGRCQILNFGIPAYGIDQIYLRYLQDVRSWHPDLVIFSFINNDLPRAMSVYGFLMFANGEFPFAKPRFILRGDQLELLKVPVASATDLFATASIHDLPEINYDIGYFPLQWEREGWEWLTRSYLLRFLVSLHPLYDLERPEVSRQAMMDLNGALITKLRQAILDDGAKLLIVPLPDIDDFQEGVKNRWGLQLLESLRVPYIDILACMKGSSVSELFNAPSIGGHYSPKGNRETARCLFEEVKTTLGGRFS